MAASAILDEIKKLTVVELAELVKSIEEEFGVSAAAPVAIAAVASAEGGAVEAEKSEYKVTLTDAGSEKIKVIKALRAAVQGLGLKEAKEMAEGVPSVISEALPKEDAQKVKASLEEVGAKVTLS
ncbi:50S ribosomal protein L7/L12 [Candidatus Babeliales bacterium]|nr:50S ribosomal protein L7/L12 [Candidatus Babeliales bacterium]